LPFVCWLFIFKVTEPSSIPYRTHSACAKRAAYPRSLVIKFLSRMLMLAQGLTTSSSSSFSRVLVTKSVRELLNKRNSLNRLKQVTKHIAPHPGNQQPRAAGIALTQAEILRQYTQRRAPTQILTEPEALPGEFLRVLAVHVFACPCPRPGAAATAASASTRRSVRGSQERQLQGETIVVYYCRTYEHAGSRPARWGRGPFSRFA
jgi:hypothetical protein